MGKTKKLIVVTNDDGIKSPGLVAAVQALRGLGEILVVAPKKQESSAGRAFYWRARSGRKYRFRVGERVYPAYAVDASPAVSVRYALQLIAQRPPALVVSGINYGENMGNGLTISGTVGAALEAAAEGVPALAVSLQTATEYHSSHSTAVDFRSAGYFTRLFAGRMLHAELPRTARLLNVNVPGNATHKTPWRITCASTQAYFRSIVKDGRFAGYDVNVDVETLEPDSDIYAVFVDHVVSVTPLPSDLTARVELPAIEKVLNNAHTR
jgi:5'/3'-nucleotidase